MNQPIPLVVLGTSVLVLGNAIELARMPEFRVIFVPADDPDVLRQCCHTEATVVICDMNTVDTAVLDLLRQVPQTVVIGLESDQNTLLALHGQHHPVASVPDLAAIIQQQVALRDGIGR